MGIHFGKIASNLHKGAETIEDTFKKDLAPIAKDPSDFGDDVNAIKDAFFDAGAESVGMAELLGVRYPVSAYQSPVGPDLTRGSRLDAAGISDLQARGFKGIVNLCMENDDDAAAAKSVGLNALHLEILDNSAPTEAQMKQFLDFATANAPCYVHCEAGQGRTGVASACYRMAVQGWTVDAALADAKQHGLQLPDQIAFLQQFGADLQAGKIAGYPKA